MVSKTSRDQTLAWVPRGVYIGLPPRGYNGNLAGRGAQPSVSTIAGFCVDCWGPPAAGSLVDRQAPLSSALSVAGYCRSILVTRASPRWAWLQCRRLAGDRCSLTASCLLNGASPLREVASRLWGAGSILGRLGEVGPPSDVSLTEGARRLQAVQATHRGCRHDPHGNSASPVGGWPPCMAYCSHACSGIRG